jgi:hypothetical protein
LAALLAPLLGLVSLAGAYPALAGQARSWRHRAALGALGYWWLRIAEPLLGRRLWLSSPAPAPARSIWEGSLDQTASHVLGPLLSIGTLAGTAVWAVAALALPLLVRGTRAGVDVFAATVWSAVLFSAARSLDYGPGALVHPSPRGALLGAVAGGLLAVGARALRGPV